MEDWQQWQIRADEIATDLRSQVDSLENDVAGDEINFRAFWPKFRALKESVRIAPAIRLEDKLDLERRLRAVGSKAYKGQESAVARSNERRVELLESIAALRATAEKELLPRALRAMRRDFDRIRESFDSGTGLVSADRQAVWDAWREANQFAWQRLESIWGENENLLREILVQARQNLERGNASAVRQSIGRFFETLKSHEAKQQAVNAMKAEVDEIRREADSVEERRMGERTGGSISVSSVPALQTWRADLARNNEVLPRLSQEVAALERQVSESTSILDQAMLRGTLVEKKQKLAELERSSRTLSQKIEQSEENPLIPSGLG